MRIELNVTKQFLQDILCQIFETNVSRYWAILQSSTIDEPGNYIGFTVHEHGDEEMAVSKHRIGVQSLRIAVRRILSADFNSKESHAIPSPSYATDLFKAINDEDSIDSDLADIILQVACFGHVIYG